jgi:hypothetical protein
MAPPFIYRSFDDGLAGTYVEPSLSRPGLLSDCPPLSALWMHS